VGINLIRKNNQESVTAYQDSILFHFIKGHDQSGQTIGGVFHGYGDMFDNESNQIDKKFIVKSGMGIIFGRQFEIQIGNQVEFNFQTITGVRYILIYVEIDTRDLMNQKIEVKALYQTTSYPIVYSDDLITTEQGVARMPLYRVLFMSSQASPIVTVTKVFYTFEAHLVEEAKRAQSLPGTSTINGRSVNDIVNNNRNTVKKSDDTEKVAGQLITHTSTRSLRMNSEGYIKQSRLMLSGTVTLPAWSNEVTVTSLIAPMRFMSFKVAIKAGSNQSSGNDDFYLSADYLKINQGKWLRLNGTDIKIDVTESTANNVPNTQITMTLKNVSWSALTSTGLGYRVYGEAF
jgi:hypothetical protein